MTTSEYIILEVRTFLSAVDKMSQKRFTTRKSSCVNARGIPCAAQQVLAVLLWLTGLGGGGYLLWPGGYLPRLGETEVPTPSQAGYRPWLGVPIQGGRGGGGPTHGPPWGLAPPLGNPGSATAKDQFVFTQFYLIYFNVGGGYVTCDTYYSGLSLLRSSFYCHV